MLILVVVTPLLHEVLRHLSIWELSPLPWDAFKLGSIHFSRGKVCIHMRESDVTFVNQSCYIVRKRVFMSIVFPTMLPLILVIVQLVSIVLFHVMSLRKRVHGGVGVAMLRGRGRRKSIQEVIVGTRYRIWQAITNSQCGVLREKMAGTPCCS